MAGPVQMNLKRRVTLRPADLGREIEEKLRRKLMTEVEGTCDSNGYIIACMSILDKGPGRIDELTGSVSFQVRSFVVLAVALQPACLHEE